MANRPTKYKICYQNRINLWEQKKLYNFKHKKWLWLSSKKKKTHEVLAKMAVKTLIMERRRSNKKIIKRLSRFIIY